ncbi:MAG: Voltage gated chloride channel family protein [Clostridiaceae bacterium]|nr:Voltage gated chloride channel family protein [Clostridiaceae bacterium]
MHDESSENNIYNTLSQWHNLKLNLVLEGICIGALTGLIIVLYRLSIEKLGELTKRLYAIQKHNYWYIIVWIIALIILGYIVGTLVRKEPMISGSGIPQTEGVLLRHLDMNWLTVIISKFIGGIISLGAGLSLGREGPSIQIGAAVGQGFSRTFKRLKVEEKFLITSGASAGLASAFNAPLAGVIFSLEEIHKNFSPLILLSAMSSALTADFVSKEFFGLNPVFDFHKLSPLTLNNYFYLILLGVIVGTLGVVFNVSLLKTLKIYDSAKWLKTELKPIIPFVLAGILAIVLPQVLGGGHELILSLVNNNFAIGTLILLVIVKFIFTMISYGSGAPGGIFLPLLVIGALIGCIFGNLATLIFHMNPVYINNFIILGMAGYFTAIVRSPITGSILITEMTGSFSHLLSLTIVSIVAYIVADAMGSKPVYEALLDRILINKEKSYVKNENTEKIILEVPVSIGSMLENKKIKEVKWPQYCLLVGVKRGIKEIIPKGNTMLYAGDYLIVLVDEDKSIDIRNKLLEYGDCCILNK